ncbi:hypothetical protein BD289DRAFT_134148 [Coniella lustricola]|uniref:Uncharacterized protein n=1 Tax=Coniella lustricola TaxID=2025994 RepID=A0A2T2ZVS7_9PEZI|nr:hypothetical protein BD289DRAFT_134148 [Coniella lustricola]
MGSIESRSNRRLGKGESLDLDLGSRPYSASSWAVHDIAGRERRQARLSVWHTAVRKPKRGARSGVLKRDPLTLLEAGVAGQNQSRMVTTSPAVRLPARRQGRVLTGCKGTDDMFGQRALVHRMRPQTGHIRRLFGQKSKPSSGSVLASLDGTDEL